jgi:hypothetical protein
MTARKANPGWAAIGVFVIGHNVIAAGRGDEMLSEACDRYLKNHPVLTTSVVAAVALHLINALPPFADPLGVAMNTIARMVGPLR